MFQNIQTSFNKLCSPAQFHVILSVISILLIFIQNTRNTRKYCVGMYECNLAYSNAIVFMMKVIYMIVWAIILDSLCKNGYKSLAWWIVLLPFISMFILIGIFMFTNM